MNELEQGASLGQVHSDTGELVVSAQDHLAKLDENSRARLAQRLAPSRFAGDEGLVLPQTKAALELLNPGERAVALAKAMANERVLVPVLPHNHPHAGNQMFDPEVKAKQSKCDSSDLAVLELEDGRKGVAVFTSLAALHQWDKDARPLPTNARSLAIGALAQGRGRFLVNPIRGEECALSFNAVLGTPAVNALGCAGSWLPAWQDRDLLGYILNLLVGSALSPVRIEAGASGRERLIIAVPAEFAQVDRDTVMYEVTQIGQVLSEDERVLAACDGLELVPVLMQNGCV